MRFNFKAGIFLKCTEVYLLPKIQTIFLIKFSLLCCIFILIFLLSRSHNFFLRKKRVFTKYMKSDCLSILCLSKCSATKALATNPSTAAGTNGSSTGRVGLHLGQHIRHNLCNLCIIVLIHKHTHTHIERVNHTRFRLHTVSMSLYSHVTIRTNVKWPMESSLSKTNILRTKLHKYKSCVYKSLIMQKSARLPHLSTHRTNIYIIIE